MVRAGATGTLLSSARRETTDRLDEILCPYDLDWDHPLTDDDLAAACANVPRGARLIRPVIAKSA